MKCTTARGNMARNMEKEKFEFRVFNTLTATAMSPATGLFISINVSK